MPSLFTDEETEPSIRQHVNVRASQSDLTHAIWTQSQSSTINIASSSHSWSSNAHPITGVETIKVFFGGDYNWILISHLTENPVPEWLNVLNAFQRTDWCSDSHTRRDLFLSLTFKSII